MAKKLSGNMQTFKKVAQVTRGTQPSAPGSKGLGPYQGGATRNPALFPRAKEQ